MSSKQYHKIPVKPETAEQIHEQKQIGDTWDDAVRRLLDDDDDDPTHAPKG